MSRVYQFNIVSTLGLKSTIYYEETKFLLELKFYAYWAY